MSQDVIMRVIAVEIMEENTVNIARVLATAPQALICANHAL